MTINRKARWFTAMILVLYSATIVAPPAAAVQPSATGSALQPPSADQSKNLSAAVTPALAEEFADQQIQAEVAGSKHGSLFPTPHLAVPKGSSAEPTPDSPPPTGPQQQTGPPPGGVIACGPGGNQVCSTAADCGGPPIPGATRRQWDFAINTDQPTLEARPLVGEVKRAHVAWGDWELVHWDRDYNFFVDPDPEYKYLVGEPGNSESQELDEKGKIEVEWELHSLPDWARPAKGDRVYVEGAFVFDCGHAPARTEIHPPRLVATTRGGHAGKTTDIQDPELPEGGNSIQTITEVDIFGSSSGGLVMNEINDCWNRPFCHDVLRSVQPLDGKSYEFFIPAPEAEPGFTRMISNVIHQEDLPQTFAPPPTRVFPEKGSMYDLFLEERERIQVTEVAGPVRGVNVLIDFSNFTRPANPLYGFGFTVKVGWAQQFDPDAPGYPEGDPGDPGVPAVPGPHTLAKRVKVKIDGVTNHHLSCQPLCDPNIEVFVAVNDKNAWYPNIEITHPGFEPINGELTPGEFEVTLQPGDELRIKARIVQQDIPFNQVIGEFEGVHTAADDFGIGRSFSEHLNNPPPHETHSDAECQSTTASCTSIQYTIETVPVDHVFVIDTSGSMGSSLDAIKQTASDVAQALQDSGTDFRVAIIQYKDFGDIPDPYEVTLPFTNNLTLFKEKINELDAWGGGDKPEALYSALMGAYRNNGAEVGGWRPIGIESKFVSIYTDAAAHDPEPETNFTLGMVSAAGLEIDPAIMNVILTGNDADANMLGSLAEMSGGATIQATDYNAASSAVLDSVYESIPPMADSGPPLVAFRDPIAWVSEGGQQVIVPVELNDTLLITSSVDYQTLNPLAGITYSPAVSQGTIVFPPNTGVVTITVPLTDDIVWEPNELFGFELVNPDHLRLGALRTTTVMLTNTDHVQVADAFVVSEHQIAAPLTITLDQPLTTTLSLEYSFQDETAGGADYIAPSGVITFTPGQTTKLITVTLQDEQLAEDDEHFLLILDDPADALPAAPVSRITILDNDSVGFSDQRPGFQEHQEQAPISVTLRLPLPYTVTVDYETAPNTAFAFSDYLPVTGTLVFTPGVTTLPIILPIINDDNIDEYTEALTVTLKNPTQIGVRPNGDTATVSIYNDDAPFQPKFGPSRYVVNEVDGTVTIPVFSDFTYATTMTVEYETVNNSALAGSDYQATSGVVTFAPGEVDKDIVIALIDDTASENGESFGVQLSNPSSVSLGSPSYTSVLIRSNDRVGLETASASIHEHAPSLMVPVVLDSPSSVPVTVTYATADGSALAGVDYEAASGAVSIAPGETRAVIEIPIIDDAAGEEDESFTLALSNPLNAALQTMTATLTIVRNDHVSFEENEFVINEPQTSPFGTPDQGWTWRMVALDNPSSITVTVSVQSSDGTAIAYNDYRPVSTTLEIPPGLTQVPIQFQIFDDSLLEEEETFTLSIVGAENAEASDPSQLTIRIRPSDQVSVDQTLLNENAGRVELGLTWNAPITQAITLHYTSKDSHGTATKDLDFAPVEGTVTFSPTALTRSIPITIVEDGLLEPQEQFYVTFYDQSGSNRGFPHTQALFILANDEIEIDEESSAHEGNGVAHVITYLYPSSAQTVTLRFEALPETALAGDDFDPLSGTLEIPPFAVFSRIEIPLVDDTLPEGDETFLVRVYDADNAEIANGPVVTSTVTIRANDHVSVSGDRTELREYEPYAELRLELDSPASHPVTVTYATLDGTAAAGLDYVPISGTATFAPLQQSIPLTIPLIFDAVLDEPDETFELLLSDPVNAAIDQGAVELTIINANEMPPTAVLTPAALTIAEGAGTAGLTITLDKPAPNPFELWYTVDGTAFGWTEDYDLAGWSVAFGQGDQIKTIPITLVDDLKHEGDETIVFQFDPSIDVLTDSVLSATVTIDDNDPFTDTLQFYLPRDNRGNGAPPLDWITGTHQLALDSNDEGTATIALPFPTKLYTATLTELTVSTNGFVQATDMGPQGNNWRFDYMFSDNYGAIAPFWNDLILAESGGIYTATGGIAPNRYLAVEWRDARPFFGDLEDTYTFEVIFEEQGDIRFQYLTMSGTNGDGRLATVGIHHPDMFEWAEYGYQTPVLASGRVVEFLYPTSVLTVTPVLTATLAAMPITWNYAAFAVGDVNHDDAPDAFVRLNTSPRTIGVWMNNGSGLTTQSWTVTPTVQTQINPEIVVGRFNGDSHPDLGLVQRSSAARIELFMGDGTGHFTPTALYGIGSVTDDIEIADLNDDGALDLLATTSGAKVNVLLNNGSGGFPTRTPYVAGVTAVDAVSVADMNGDQIPDLVVGSSNDSLVSVLHGVGDGTFGTAQSAGVSESAAFPAVGDINGDGRPDAVVGSYLNTIDILFGTITGTMELQSTMVVTSPALVKLADLTQDGYLDLIVGQGYPLHDISVYANDGSGGFAHILTQPAPVDPMNMAFADVTQDGALDIVGVSSDTATTSTLWVFETRMIRMY